MSMTLLNSITVFVLAVFIGIEIISKVPTMLHTPLMSGTNAIHGIVLIGAMLIAGSADSDLEKALAFVPLISGVWSVVGTFEITSMPTNAASTSTVIWTTSSALMRRPRRAGGTRPCRRA
jgi:NAD(P) transhydrogenase subunit alpha